MLMGYPGKNKKPGTETDAHAFPASFAGCAKPRTHRRMMLNV